MPLLCDRPHWRTVDFETSRFIVCKASGLEIGGRRFELGDELPNGLVNSEVLRQIYDTPLRLVELAEFAIHFPDLREACARRGVDLSNQEAEKMELVEEVSEGQKHTPPPMPDLDINAMGRSELVDWCNRLGLIPYGTNLQLRERLAARLA